MEETLRREVRFLTTRLGAIVQEQCGPRVFAAIEQLRRLSKQIRQHPDPQLLETSSRAVSRLRLDEATAVAHAFSLFFHLVNLCEERQRVRRLRAYERHESGAPMSLRRTFADLRRARIPSSALSRLLQSMRVEPVLTAHPTEAKRRSVMNHLWLIGLTLDELASDPSAAPESRIDPWVEALWLTEEVRERPVTPEVEIESARVYLEKTIYDLAGSLWERFRAELRRSRIKVVEPLPLLRFGSWVGGDRDGNPNVTPEFSLQAAEVLRQSVLGYYQRSCDHLLSVLSFPCTRPHSARALQASLQSDFGRLPELRTLEGKDQPHELFRRKVRVILARLERTAKRASGAYLTPAEFVDDLRLIDEAVRRLPGPRVAEIAPRRLRVAAEVFGFHAVSLDFRQHSSLTREAADGLLTAYGMPLQPADARIKSIRQILGSHSAGDLPPGAKTPPEFGALKQIQDFHGEHAAHRYIISMATHAADVWDVVLLAHTAGLVARDGKGLRSSIDVVPLFETYDDLQRGAQVLDELVADPLYRSLIDSRDRFQEVMLGYSDSVKDSGYVAANWALFHAQEKLAQVARKRGIRLGLFHGKGGSIDRGGGISYRTVQAQPNSAPGGRLRITEQGEVISLKYSNPVIAERNLEQLVASVLSANLLHPARIRRSRMDRWQEYAEDLAAHSRTFYRQLVYETPEFAQYFYQATPIDLIEHLPLGSRPARRLSGRDLSDLRAIPWVFAWTQSRHFLPSWYGVGYALERFADAQGANGLSRLRGMYRTWPFFSALMDNAEASLAKTDLDIAARYAKLVHPVTLRDTIFGKIEQEYQRSRRMVLLIAERSHLLAHQPVLAESIRLRNPYVDPLNLLQIRFLEAWRKSRQPRPELLRALQITVGGIAFGMKSTG
ncbi:MAG TPA: phosphoenolpyruvate carboxylase [Terriglobia bacterium]